MSIGRIFLDYRGRLTDTLTAHATLNTYGDHDNNPVDVTETYLDWRPFPAHGWRWRTKLGAFYPPISLENRAAGWSSPYSLTSSAINTWLGEEFRTIGAEVTATWLGSQQNGWVTSASSAASTNSTTTRACSVVSRLVDQ